MWVYLGCSAGVHYPTVEEAFPFTATSKLFADFTSLLSGGNIGLFPEGETVGD
jgi:hypothetical protein